MITVTLSLALVPYAVLLVIGLFVATVSAYHLVHYGATTRISFIVTFIFYAGTVLLLFTTWVLLKDVAWEEPLTIGPAAGAAQDVLY